MNFFLHYSCKIFSQNHIFIFRQKQFFDSSDSLDAKQIFNNLEELDSDDDEYQTVQNSKCLDIVFFPPEDKQDNNQDDATSDEEGLKIRDIGKGTLKQSMEVHTISKDGERTILQSIVKYYSIISDESDIQEKLKYKQRKRYNKKVQRNWEPVNLCYRPNKLGNLKYETPRFAEKCAKLILVE